MAGYGPPTDPSRQPTRRAEVNAGYPPPRPSAPSDPAPVTDRYAALKTADPEPAAPTPWYRRRVVLVAWGLLVSALIVLIIYGLAELAGRGEGGPAPTQTTSTTPTTSPTTPTTTAGTTPTTSPPPSATEEEPPPISEPPRAPAPAAPPPGGSAPPSHRHHLPKLPPTISVPGGPVITIPRGF